MIKRLDLSNVLTDKTKAFRFAGAERRRIETLVSNSSLKASHASRFLLLGPSSAWSPGLEFYTGYEVAERVFFRRFFVIIIITVHLYLIREMKGRHFSVVMSIKIRHLN